jgi:hypothetical protein
MFSNFAAHRRKGLVMMILKRMVVASCLVSSVMVVAGCGGVDSGPADPSTVPKVDPATVEQALSNEQSRRYMPKGGKIPTGVGSSSAPSEPGK